MIYLKYIAHKLDSGQEESITEHLTKTAILSKGFGEKFGFGDLTEICGIYHDIGKYSEKFQKRIRYGGNSVDHSTAGAQEVDKNYKNGKLLAYCIAGHHSGLPDGGSIVDSYEEPTLEGRLKKKIEPYENYKENKFYLDNKQVFLPINPQDNFMFSISFAVRMLYSCLVDGDFLATEDFMQSGNIDRGINVSFKELLKFLNKKIESFPEPIKELNKKRTNILEQCIKKSELPKGIYTLTVPTGGGKTISSLAFAINHALKYKMDRIIYVIPYTSIIEQNAKVFKEILGEKYVLEHHSNFDFNQLNDDIIGIKQKLACENWDIPIIVTTNVQFFESFFSNKPSRCRKLHNVANSVIIFDEAQMIPLNYLKPCIYAIKELVQNYKSTALLCTATQPAFENIFPKATLITEIIDGKNEMYEAFKKVKIINRGELSNEALADEINSSHSVLCIVNTKKHAKDLFEQIKGDGVYHLSTLMCSKHRSEILENIKEKLKSKSRCKVISTQLIEAGVDVDFPEVYRSMAGLDSIIQSAGRCNREGEMTDFGKVNVFTPEKKYSSKMFNTEISITQEIIRKHKDILSPQAIEDYFKALYFYSDNCKLDKKNIMQELDYAGKDGKMNIPFKKIATDFTMIENNTKTIVIPYDDEAMNHINKIKHSEYYKTTIRALQKYTVSLYDFQFRQLLNNGIIEPLIGDTYLLKSKVDYSEDTGLKINYESGEAKFI